LLLTLSFRELQNHLGKLAKFKLVKEYLFLFAAIIFEVLGTLLLPVTQSFSKIIPTACVLLSYLLSFYFLTLVIKKLPLTIVYASWAGLGVLAIAVLSAFFYKETFNYPVVFGLMLIVIGVVLVNVYRAA